MKRTTIFLPEDLIARLNAEAVRARVKPAELIRRALDAFVPPVETSAGELRKRIDRAGLLKVFVLDARSGRLLVEPGGGVDGMFEPLVQMWVPAHMVTFGEAADPTPAQLFRPPVPAAWEGLKTNLRAAPPKNIDLPEDMLRLNIKLAPAQESKPTESLPVPTTCGICGAPFPSKAAKKRHVRDVHTTPTLKPEEPTPGDKDPNS
jgi:hypothetical protein